MNNTQNRSASTSTGAGSVAGTGVFLSTHRSTLQRLSSQEGAEGVGTTVDAQQLLLAEALHVAVGERSRVLVFNLVHSATGNGNTLASSLYFLVLLLVHTPTNTSSNTIFTLLIPHYPTTLTPLSPLVHSTPHYAPPPPRPLPSPHSLLHPLVRLPPPLSLLVHLVDLGQSMETLARFRTAFCANAQEQGLTDLDAGT